jgi:cytochrome b561
MASNAGYTTTAKSLHWLIVALLIAQFTVAWTMPHIGRDTPVTTLISLHFTLGIVILAVAIVRLAWRAMRGEPEPEAGVPPWQTASARVVHWLLYALLLVLPILGWINASWRGMPIVMFVPKCRNWSPRAHRAGAGAATCMSCCRTMGC